MIWMGTLRFIMQFKTREQGKVKIKDFFYIAIFIGMIAWNYWVEARLGKVEEESRTFHKTIRKHGGEIGTKR